MKSFTAVVERDPETGLFVGHVPGWPGAEVYDHSGMPDVGPVTYQTPGRPEVVASRAGYDRDVGANVPIVAGIMPILNLNQIKRFISMCGAKIPHPLLTRLESLETDPEAVHAVSRPPGPTSRSVMPPRCDPSR